MMKKNVTILMTAIIGTSLLFGQAAMAAERLHRQKTLPKQTRPGIPKKQKNKKQSVKNRKQRKTQRVF